MLSSDVQLVRLENVSLPSPAAGAHRQGLGRGVRQVPGAGKARPAHSAPPRRRAAQGLLIPWTATLPNHPPGKCPDRLPQQKMASGSGSAAPERLGRLIPQPPSLPTATWLLLGRTAVYTEPRSERGSDSRRPPRQHPTRAAAALPSAALPQ